ncbi:undecaprenyl diphosphate synthase family protein [Kitasatospora sp. CMC57]
MGVVPHGDAAYFCEAYWPAFRKVDFLRALRDYQLRNRRLGL